MLLDKQKNKIKLGDFGLATEFLPDKLMTGRIGGDPRYVAPELLRSNAYNGTKVDIWGLGCILYEFMTGPIPSGGLAISARIRSKKFG